MTLRDLQDWIWRGEGLWVLNGFIQAWNILEGEERLPALPTPPQDSGAPWHGGPAYPLGVFEEDLLDELRDGLR